MAHASPGALGCRRKFLRFFPRGFGDDTYVAWERGYKWRAHERWGELLDRARHQEALRRGEFAAIARHAVTIEARTNLLFSFEKMALRDAVRSPAGAYGFDFAYRSRPGWDTYANLLEFARVVRRDLRDLHPRDQIDAQSFVWVQGSSEYDE